MKISSSISFSTITDVHNSMFNSNGFVCDHLETEESIRFETFFVIINECLFTSSSSSLFVSSSSYCVLFFSSTNKIVLLKRCRFRSMSNQLLRTKRHQMCELRRKKHLIEYSIGRGFCHFNPKERCTFVSTKLFRL